MKKSFLFSLAFPAYFGLFAQQIQNVTASQQGKNIVVSYDLTASSGDFDVALYCSTDGGSNWGNPLNSVTGDVGKSIKSGSSKQITWNVLADIEKLTGSRIVFEVRARTTSDVSIEMIFVKVISFDLEGRGSVNLPKPSYDSKEPGKVVVTIWVNAEGRVVRVIEGTKGTTITDQRLFAVAKDAALRSVFTPDPKSTDLQKGTITYIFNRQN